ncbi:cytochrome P450 [Paracoccus sp. SM22M-07]|uniref:cytochrome P450 n=1 Tax=Paracoccus sp. SM22M-07 TaxID=1520813 RepID=UPI000931641F|nr:cytochrome P450 [Paracoccus sp. SM22M-07]
MQPTSPLPHLPGIDHTTTLLRQGYDFIGRGCDRFGQDMFRARLMFRPVICARGADAARLIYDPDLFTRQGAMPTTVLRLLQDKGSVQTLDDAQHRHRKALFVSLLMSDRTEWQVVTLFQEEWRRALQQWQARDMISLLDEAGLVLTRTACRWIGLEPPRQDDVALHADLAAMIEAAGKAGPSVVKALLRRRRIEQWLQDCVSQRRQMQNPPDDPLAEVALLRDDDGTMLSRSIAAVEVLNLLRPIAAVGRYVMLCALALHNHPKWHDRVRGAPEPIQQAFAEEVRRFYPFFPAVAGRARRTFHHHGHQFAQGDWLLLDLYGSCHHHQMFPRPEEFDPRRPRTWSDQDFGLIPQGAGRVDRTHRCPGERLTVALMRRAIGLLTEEMTYTVPKQDLDLPASRIPAQPKDGFLMADIRAIGDFVQASSTNG